ncbi:MAG: SPOR domain-containing protein [Dongiaceae bacterium]
MRAFLTTTLLWAALACFAGSAAADYKKGLAAYNNSDFATAYSEWLVSAKTGDKLAQHGLGFLFELRKGIPEMPEAKSLAQAVEWYQAASTQGVAAAQTNLGLMYAQGRGVKQNYDEARKLWDQAAVSGHPMAQFNLGLLYLQGLAGTPDERKASQYFLQSARQNVPDAQYALGTMYLAGRGVTKDRDEAVAWLQKAAAAGHQRAILALSDIDKAEQQAMNEDAAQKPPEPGTSAADGTNEPATPPATAETPSTGTSAGAVPDATSSGGAAMVTPPPATVEPPAPPAESSSQASAEAPATENQPAPPVTAETPTATAEAPAVPSTEQQIPATGADTQTAEATPETPPTETAPAAAEPATPSDTQTASISTINVQMSSQKSRSEAEGSVEKLKAVYEKVVEPYDFYVKEVDLGKPKGIWYRVLVGPIPSEKDARALCAKIKAEPPHNDCLVQLK